MKAFLFTGKNTLITFATLVLAASPNQLVAQNFNVSSVLTVGNAPAFVAAADLNGDGKVDLVSANSGTNTLTVLTNTGSGTFVLSATLKVGNSPVCVVAADVNGDGKLDLISADYGSSTLTVLTNRGGGIFGSNATYIAGAQSVAAADVNGDGKVDLISVGNGCRVLTNNGTSFGFNASYSVGSIPRFVVASDVNGDGKPDLIIANGGDGGGGIMVLTNNGNGSFTLASSISIPMSAPFGVAAADLDGDGKVDLVTASYQFDDFYILTNKGQGTFGIFSSGGLGGALGCVTVTDLNGDGKMDLVFANSGATSSVFTNSGNGNFGSFLVPGGSQDMCVAAADVNGDFKMDLIFANYGTNTLTVLTNALTQHLVAPRLTMQRSTSNGVTVFWPSPSLGFSLQKNPALGTANWTAVTNAMNSFDNKNQVVLQPAPGNNFFRLLHP